MPSPCKKAVIFDFRRLEGVFSVAANFLFICMVISISGIFRPDATASSVVPRYEIDATFDPGKHRITATQKITYTNAGDTEIKELSFHIYPHRVYTKEEKNFLYRYAGYFRINPFPEGWQTGDLQIESVFSPGEKKLPYSISGTDQTIASVSLETPLKPGASTQVIIRFTVDIPHAYGRFGWHKGIITLTRWYPILSVFDKNGWHNYPFYAYHQPFFSDASQYYVKLTLPQKLTVVSTGLVRQKDINSDGTQTLFIETEVPVRDFAMGISKDFQVYSAHENGILINSYYLKGDEQRARDAARNAAGLMKFYSERFGEYPYKSFNIVPGYLGFGGDQSSGLVFIDTRAYKLPVFLDRYFDFLVSHETGHQWFYNMVGSDEYKEMFLDEGVNSYWILRYLEHKYGENAKVLVLPEYLKKLVPNFSFKDTSYARYLYMAKNGIDRPVIGALSSFKEPSSIFALTYGKGSAILEMLEKLVGRETFDRIMSRYAAEYKFKNVSLDEFMSFWNKETGRDITWFFDQWLKTDKKIDFSVKSVKKRELVLENKGNLRMPVDTTIRYRDGSEQNVSWDGNDPVKSLPVEQGKIIKSVEIDPGNAVLLDLDRTNNSWPRKIHSRLVPLYFFAYEIPLVMPLDAYTVTAGPSVGGSSLGIASSVVKPFDGMAKVSSVYDFGGKSVDSRFGYELKHVGNTQTAAGFEIFDYESSKENNDLRGGKVYVRRELWPANYGLFDMNDHVTAYFIRDQKVTNESWDTTERITNYHYKKNDESIIGITGSLGRCGPYPDPDTGWRFMPTQEVAGHFLGGKEAFWRASAELNNYFPVIPKYQHKLATRIKAGWGESSGKKLFQLGGYDGLRGYDSKTIEGAHMVLSEIEYRFPVLTDMNVSFLKNWFTLAEIQAVGFFDIGRAWYSSFSGSSFKKDAGLGLRAHLDTFGFLERVIVRLDVAQAINEPKSDPHIWFGLSHVF